MYPKDMQEVDTMSKLRYIALALALGLALTACAETGGSADPNSPGAVTQPTAEGGVANESAGNTDSVSTVDDNAEALYGTSVTVNGPVIEIYNEQMFRIDDPELLGGDDVLVLMPAGGMAVTEGQSLEVSGVVQMFDQSELEQTLGLDIDDALGTDLAGQPVIVAENVTEAAASN
jgi:uncharacterized protein YdeI (BOF family)